MFNSLWPSDSTWHYITWSALIQAWWHKAITWTSVDLPSKESWSFHFESNFTRSTHPQHVFGDYTIKITTTSPRGQWVGNLRWNQYSNIDKLRGWVCMRIAFIEAWLKYHMLFQNLQEISTVAISIAGCMKDSLVGEEFIADYLLFWLNKHRKFRWERERERD